MSFNCPGQTSGLNFTGLKGAIVIHRLVNPYLMRRDLVK